MMAGKRNPYEDILHLPHHKASNRPQMSLHDRAAQFSPFAALSGFDGVIAETGRLTGRRKALTEEEKEGLNRKLALIADRLREGDHPLVTVTFFVPDALKDGGEYLEYAGRVRKIDPVAGMVQFLAENGRSGGKTISMEDICRIRRGMAEGVGERKQKV